MDVAGARRELIHELCPYAEEKGESLKIKKPAVLIEGGGFARATLSPTLFQLAE